MLILLQQLTVHKKYILVDKQMAESDISSKGSPVGGGVMPGSSL